CALVLVSLAWTSPRASSRPRRASPPSTSPRSRNGGRSLRQRILSRNDRTRHSINLVPRPNVCLRVEATIIRPPEREDCTIVAWYRSIYAPRTGGAYDSHHRTTGIAGCTRRRGGVAARGARAAVGEAADDRIPWRKLGHSS